MNRENRVISLLTDFGLTDEYAGVMKGVILSHCLHAQLIDISHNVPPQNIQYAARLLQHSYKHFPVGTIHLIVVDPGVGSNRKIILIECSDHIFIAPDNGVLTPIIQSENLQRCYRLKDEYYCATSNTFHGRDIMAPIAGQIATGIPPSQFGEEIDSADCVIVSFPGVKKIGETLFAEVTGVDHFGNIATSITATDLSVLSGKIVFIIGSATIRGLHKTYAEVPKGQMLALIDSRGYVELSMNSGNAAKIIDCVPGDPLQVKTE